MRDVLIVGGAGKIGFNLVEKLLDTNYSVTILDLESKRSISKFEGIKDKVKIVYGDVEDANLVKDLVRKNDIVIDYAGIMPPLANLNEGISKSTNYLGTKNIVDAINDVNPECIFIYMSFISVYGETDNKKREITLDTESSHPDDFYSIDLIRSEEYIKDKLKKYCIFRMPIVLTSKNYFIKHIALGKEIDVLTRDDVNDLIIPLMKDKKIFGKTYNIPGLKVKSEDLVRGLYKITGELAIMNRNLYYGEFEDNSDVSITPTDFDIALEEMRVRIPKSKRVFKKIFNYPKYLIFKRKVKKLNKKSK